jgi:hypothetical protein
MELFLGNEPTAQKMRSIRETEDRAGMQSRRSGCILFLIAITISQGAFDLITICDCNQALFD